MRKDISADGTARPALSAAAPFLLFLLLSAVASAGAYEGRPGMPLEGPWIHPFWLVTVLLSVACWFYATAWTADDSMGIGMNYHFWTGIFLGIGWFGMLLVLFLHPVFALLLPFGLAGTAAYYIKLRNEKVPLQRQLLTSILGSDEAKLTQDGDGAEAGEEGGRRSDTEFVNEDGKSMREFAERHQGLSESIELLGELVVRVSRARVSVMKIIPGQAAFVVEVLKDGVRSKIDSVDRELGRLMVTAVARFCKLAGKGKAGSRLTASFPGEDDVVMSVKGAKTKAGVGLTFIMPEWTPELYKKGPGALGMEESMVDKLKLFVSDRPCSVIISGPKKSGRTETFYAVISLVDIFMNDVVTFEKSASSKLNQVKQIEVDPGSAEAFEKVLPAVLREEPHVLACDGLSDAAVASHLFNFAGEDGLMIGTMEAQSAAEALAVMNKKIQDDSLKKSVKAVTSQRLVRRLCLECREEFEPGPGLLAKLKIKPDNPGHWFKPVGCDKCLGTGYDGLVGLYEMLVVTEDVRNALSRNDATPKALRNAAGSDAYQTLYESAIKKVQEGLTTLKEVRRVLS